MNKKFITLQFYILLSLPPGFSAYQLPPLRFDRVMLFIIIFCILLIYTSSLSEKKILVLVRTRSYATTCKSRHHQTRSDNSISCPMMTMIIVIGKS